MKKIFLFSQNVKLSSFEKLKQYIYNSDELIFLTTHFLFDSERKYITQLFSDNKITFVKFADFLSDEENKLCDESSYNEKQKSVSIYYEVIKRNKNILILNKIKSLYGTFTGYLLSDDLGIEASVWKKNGFKQITMDYYYIPQKSTGNLRKVLAKNVFLRNVYHLLLHKKYIFTDDVYLATWQGKKYIFIGKLGRVEYRLNLEFEKSVSEWEKLNKGIFYKKDECQYLSTLHESVKCKIPDNNEYDVRYIQDGYLPPNYSSFYLKFKPKNVQYYAWDILGEETFKNQALPVSIMPFRRKLYLPEPVFPTEIKNVLITASGSGDWTAQKNRSDDDLMVAAFVEVARQFPTIQFVYRCHPTWTHPNHVGVNAVNRVVDYLNSTGLQNIRVSSNIPSNSLGNYQLTFSRSSLEEDLKNSDIVFGEHSVSMLDAAFDKKPFASVNLTGRRNLFEGINRFGFTSCDSVKAICSCINGINDIEFQKKYLQAVKAYNEMTDKE